MWLQNHQNLNIVNTTLIITCTWSHIEGALNRTPNVQQLAIMTSTLANYL